MRFEKKFLKNSVHFDSEWYLESYPDVSAVNMDPVGHFTKYGMTMHRLGSPIFRESDSYYSYLEYKYRELQNARSLKLSTDDLVKKMKAGFQSLSLHLLDDLVEDFEGRDKKERSRAAWELAKAYATLDKWHKTEFYLKKTRYLDAAFMRKKRPKLLEIETLARLGYYEKAHDRLSYPLAKSIDGDFLCGLSNLIYREGGKDTERLTTINQLYAEYGLSDLYKKDSYRPFDFFNLNSSSSKTVQYGPKISVLLPVYNAEEFLELSVGSLLAQTYRNLEIVAVDDKSTDNSYNLLLELAARDDRLKVYQNTSNSGAYPTRNHALGLATGDVITVHDSDDWSHPEMLATQMQVLENGEAKVTFSFMVRVSKDLEFSLRPERNNMEYIHRSYPSLMIRRADLDLLGEWDAITANADDEFVQRARLVFGSEKIVDVLPEVPMSFFLKHAASLTSDPKTSLKSLDYGVRKEYALQAKFWRVQQDSYHLTRSAEKFPFPIPNGLNPAKKNVSQFYDLIIISDLTLLGGTRRCNQSYIEAARDMGLKVGVFHWPRFDLKLVDDIAKEYRELSFSDNVDVLTWEESVSTKCLIIHHPPLLNYEPDNLPNISVDKVSILVNQSPKQLYSQEPYYYNEDQVDVLCNRLFGLKPEWISISPAARQILESYSFKNLSQDIWYPPVFKSASVHAILKENEKFSSLPIVGRHARDHWTKWPATRVSVENAYLANRRYTVKLLGGANHALNLLCYKPKNWEVFPFDSINVSSFLKGIDFFVHFTHHDYIEEFGRNIAEAMQAGVVVILPYQFETTFGNAAVYCLPEEVESTIENIWNSPEEYNKLVGNGLAFVEKHVSFGRVVQRLKSLLGAA